MSDALSFVQVCTGFSFPAFLKHFVTVVSYYDTRVELVVGRRRFKNTVRKTAIVYPHERAQLDESSSRTGVGLVDKIASRLVV